MPATLTSKVRERSRVKKAVSNICDFNRPEPPIFYDACLRQGGSGNHIGIFPCESCGDCSKCIPDYVAKDREIKNFIPNKKCPDYIKVHTFYVAE